MFCQQKRIRPFSGKSSLPENVFNFLPQLVTFILPAPCLFRFRNIYVHTSYSTTQKSSPDFQNVSQTPWVAFVICLLNVTLSAGNQEKKDCSSLLSNFILFFPRSEFHGNSQLTNVFLSACGEHIQYLRVVVLGTIHFPTVLFSFRGPKSGDKPILSSTETLIDGFWNSNVVKGSVGKFLANLTEKKTCCTYE